MKSNIPTRQSVKKEFREIAKEEIRKQKEEFCPGCMEQMQNQTIAVLLLALHNRYGFGKKRLKEVLECANGLGFYIHDNGDKYEKAVAKLKKYGIDLEKG